MASARSIPLRLVVLFAIASLFSQTSKVLPPPATPKRPVTAEYHGVRVTENYRWLEDWDDPAVKVWSASQNARSREYLDHLPSRAALLHELKDLAGKSSVEYTIESCVRGKLFAMKADPAKQQPLLVALASAYDLTSEKVVVDPNSISATGSVVIDLGAPSLDGKYVAVSLSANGSEDGTARVYEVETGKLLPDRVPRVNFPTGGVSIAWKRDNSGFYCTRYPQGSERPKQDLNFYQRVYFHKLGAESVSDTYVVGKEFPRIAETKLATNRKGDWLIASVKNGDGGEIAHYLMDPARKWRQVSSFRDAVVSAQFGEDGYLYLFSRKDAPRGKVLRVSMTDPSLSKAEVIVPETPLDPARDDTRAAMEGVTITKDCLFVSEIDGGPSRVRVFDHSGRVLGVLPQPPVSAVNTIVPLENGDVLFPVETYLQRPAWYRWSPDRGKSEATALVARSPMSFDDAEVVREFATSRDGTRVPINIIRKKATVLNGANPVLLYAYGGYGASEKPYFYGERVRVWLNAGGVFAVANIRGGAEYGEDWHKAGNLTHKQNVFDDYIACAEYLIRRGYTSPSRLAALGVSNGGLLMGAVLTQRPHLFGAVASYVGFYDLLRFELEPNGAFNTTEFGTVKVPEQFKALYAYSPYHNVEDRTEYPAIMLLTGENDGRVNPYHSRKLLARLQAANTGTHPILLRTSSTTGHGFDSALDEQIGETADVFAFLFDQLGVHYPPIAAGH